ncbi:MAG: hypothetical protein ACRDRH_19985 [Pseudonocardia sp.]
MSKTYRVLPAGEQRAAHHDTAVVVERLIGPKTDEAPEFQPLLRGLPVGGWAVVPITHHSLDVGHGCARLRP